MRITNTWLINLYKLKCTNEIETWMLIEYRRSCMGMYVGKNVVGSALYYRREAWFSVINVNYITCSCEHIPFQSRIFVPFLGWERAGSGGGALNISKRIDTYTEHREHFA